MANFNWGTGEQRQNILGNKGTKSFGNTGTKRFKREDKKNEKKMACDISLQPFRKQFFFFFNLFAQNCGSG